MITVEKPNVNDIKDIFNIIKFFSGKNSLLSKSEEDLYRRINDLYVVKDNSIVVGSAAIVVYNDKYAEIGSLAVSPEYQKKQCGLMLLNAVLEKTKELQIENLFALTYVPEFFKKQGFIEIDKDELPHKIWKDCINCAYFPKCNEIAVIKKVRN